MSLLKVNEIQIFNGTTVTITAPAVITANDNSNAALRITQTGTGNALVVEDSANPDSTPFMITGSGAIVAGFESDIFSTKFTVSNNASLLRATANANGFDLNIAKTRSTTGEAGSAVSDNDVIGSIIYKADDGAAFITAAQISASIDGTPGANDMPGRLVFSTTADNASSPTERMRIDSSGNVGIGTTSPAQKLDVSGNINATGALTLGTALAIAEGGTGATDAATARTNLDVDQAGTDNSTDVTLVTTSHDYLSITGQAITLGPIDLAADVTGSLPYASVSGTPTLGTAAAEDVGYFATAAQGTLADSAVQPGDNAADLGSGAATDGYVLTADGIGGAAWEAASGGAASLPIDLLSSGASIRKSDGTTAVLSESGGVVTLANTSLGDTVLMPDNSNNVSTAPGIRFEADTDTGIGLASTGTLAFVTAGAERMSIDSNGRVGIGTSSPSTFLHIKDSNGGLVQTIEAGDSGAAYIKYINSTTGSGSFADGLLIGIDTDESATFWQYESVHMKFGTSGTERMRIDSSGKALIGYTSSNGSYKLQVNSQIFATSATIATSDGRYKENITPLDGALNLVTQLNPVQFNWKEHPVHEFDRAQPTVGFIAQEVQEVLKDTPYVNSIIKVNDCTIQEAVYETIEISPAIPEELDENGEVITPAQEAVTEQRLVSEAITEEFLGIAEGNLIALLTKALQEANAKIDALETRIQALEV